MTISVTSLLKLIQILHKMMFLVELHESPDEGTGTDAILVVKNRMLQRVILVSVVMQRNYFKQVQVKLQLKKCL